MKKILMLVWLSGTLVSFSGCFEQKIEVEQGTEFVCNECEKVIRKDTKKLFVPVSREKEYRIKKNTLEICYSCAMERRKNGGEFIMGNGSSKCYHEPDCGAAKRIKKVNRTYFKSKTFAERAGYVPCQICKP